MNHIFPNSLPLIIPSDWCQIWSTPHLFDVLQIDFSMLPPLSLYWTSHHPTPLWHHCLAHLNDSISFRSSVQKCTSHIWCPSAWLLNATTLILPLVLSSSNPSLASSFGTPWWFNELQIKCSKAPKHTFPYWCSSYPVLKAHLTDLMTFGSRAQRYLSDLLHISKMP